MDTKLIHSSYARWPDVIAIDNKKLQISFRRTIRVPDNDNSSLLPPDLGTFPLYSVNALGTKLPQGMAAKGGLLFPMHSNEAMWIRFESDRQFAIKVYLGGINAVSGEPAAENMATTFRRQKLQSQGSLIQDYVVTPNQLWLDGIATGPGIVRQFVATTAGSGYSVEAQITGEDAVAGLQFEITRRKAIENEVLIVKNDSNQKSHILVDLEFTTVKRAVDLAKSVLDNPDEVRTVSLRFKSGKTYRPSADSCSALGSFNAGEIEELYVEQLPLFWDPVESTIHLVSRSCGGGGPEHLGRGTVSYEMAVAVGGLIKQSIHRDNYHSDTWDPSSTIVFNVQILNAENFNTMTGIEPPPAPDDWETYKKSGGKFFDIPEASSTLSGKFNDVKSIGQLSVEEDIDVFGDGFETRHQGPNAFDHIYQEIKNGEPKREFRTVEDIERDILQSNIVSW